MLHQAHLTVTHDAAAAAVAADDDDDNDADRRRSTAESRTWKDGVQHVEMRNCTRDGDDRLVER